MGWQWPTKFTSSKVRSQAWKIASTLGFLALLSVRASSKAWSMASSLACLCSRRDSTLAVSHTVTSASVNVAKLHPLALTANWLGASLAEPLPSLRRARWRSSRPISCAKRRREAWVAFIVRCSIKTTALLGRKGEIAGAPFPSPLPPPGELPPRALHFHRQDAGAVGDQPAASHDHPPHRFTGFGVYFQGRVGHFLFHFKPSGPSVWSLGYRFVNVSGHSAASRSRGFSWL